MTEAIRRKNRLAVTMMEICIVGILSSVILGVGFAMMSRSNRQFKKGNDMISIQRLMDNIVERIRTDVRSLKRVNLAECDENSFDFTIIKDGEEANITYKFNLEEKTLYRTEVVDGETKNSDFHGAKQVISLVFTPVFDDETEKTKFNHLNVAMQIAANDYSNKEKDASTLSIACQFYSTCVESELRIFNLKKKKTS